MKRARQARLVAVTAALAVHAGLAGLYLRAVPAFNWPDEPAHFNRIRAIAEGRGLELMRWEPEALHILDALKTRHFRPTGPEMLEAIRPIRYEEHQPPLYYLAAAAVYRVLPSVTALKLLGLLASCLSMLLTYRAVRILVPARPAMALAAVAFMALWPMRAYLAVSVGNDVLAELAFSALVAAVAARSRPAWIGVICGLGLLVKVHLLLTLPLYALWLLLRREGKARVLRAAVRAGIVAIVVAAPWLAWNVAHYGWADPLALHAGALGSDAAELAAHGAARPRLEWSGPYGPLAFVRILFQSWWGVFGWMELFPEPWMNVGYLAIAGLTAWGLARIVAARGQGGVAAAPARGELAWMGLAVAGLVAALVVYSLRDFQAQGRYLMAAAGPSALLFAAGFLALPGRFRAWALGAAFGFLAAANLVLTLRFLPHFMQ